MRSDRREDWLRHQKHPRGRATRSSASSLQLGESPACVSKQAGHSSMDITIRVYGHFIPGANRDAMNRLSASISTKQASNRAELHKRSA